MSGFFSAMKWDHIETSKYCVIDVTFSIKDGLYNLWLFLGEGKCYLKVGCLVDKRKNPDPSSSNPNNMNYTPEIVPVSQIVVQGLTFFKH